MNWISNREMEKKSTKWKTKYTYNRNRRMRLKLRLHTLMGIVCILATKEIIGTVEQKKSWHTSYAIKHYTVHDFHSPKGVTTVRVSRKYGTFTFSCPTTKHGRMELKKTEYLRIIYENFMVYIFFVVHMIVAAEHRIACSNHFLHIFFIFLCANAPALYTLQRNAWQWKKDNTNEEQQ